MCEHSSESQKAWSDVHKRTTALRHVRCRICQHEIHSTSRRRLANCSAQRMCAQKFSLNAILARYVCIRGGSHRSLVGAKRAFGPMERVLPFAVCFELLAELRRAPACDVIKTQAQVLSCPQRCCDLTNCAMALHRCFHTRQLTSPRRLTRLAMRHSRVHTDAGDTKPANSQRESEPKEHEDTSPSHETPGKQPQQKPMTLTERDAELMEKWKDREGSLANSEFEGGKVEEGYRRNVKANAFRYI